MILHSNKLKSILSLLVFIAISYAGDQMVANREGGAYFVLGFGVLGVIVCLVQIIPTASHLKIGEQGFECKTLFRTDFIEWKTVNRFFSVNVAGKHMVAWTLTTKPLSGISFRLSRAHGVLPESYGMTVDELVDLLNEAQQNFQKKLNHNNANATCSSNATAKPPH